MTGDLKKRIEGARNKWEEAVKTIPGYKGYKEKELRREADRLVRFQVAHSLEGQRLRLNRIALKLTTAGNLTSLLTVDRASMRLQSLIDRIKLASYGYAGLFDAVKVKEAELDALYSFDASLMEGADKVRTLVDATAAADKEGDVAQTAEALLEALEDLNVAFSKRQDVILQAASA